MSKTRLVHNLQFSEIGQTNKTQKKGALAFCVETGDDCVLVEIPAHLSTGKVKYPICSNCETPVVWSYGHCRCKNLKEGKSGSYEAGNLLFEHKTWSV